MKDIEKMDNKAFYSQLKKFAVPIALQTFMTVDNKVVRLTHGFGNVVVGLGVSN